MTRRAAASKRKSPGSKHSRKLGQADALAENFSDWLQHLLSQSRTWVVVAVWICKVFCCRISQALQLRSKDWDFANRRVYFKPFKGAAGIWKPMLGALLVEMETLRKKGVKQARTVNRGSRGTVNEVDVWTFPTSADGYLFPSTRKDSKQPHVSKGTACKMIQRARLSFKVDGKLFERRHSIRTHSSRHHMINALKSSGLAEEAGMRFANIKNRRTGCMQIFTRIT